MFEKLENKNILGESTDIWALGVTLYYMLTGSYPHEDSTDLEDLQNKIQMVETNLDRIKSEKCCKILRHML